MPTARTHAADAGQGLSADVAPSVVVESDDLGTNTWTNRQSLPVALIAPTTATQGERMVVTGFPFRREVSHTYVRWWLRLALRRPGPIFCIEHVRATLWLLACQQPLDGRRLNAADGYHRWPDGFRYCKHTPGRAGRRTRLWHCGQSPSWRVPLGCRHASHRATATGARRGIERMRRNSCYIRTGPPGTLAWP